MILNLTKHRGTPEQKVEGVEDLPATERMELLKLLSFAAPPSAANIQARAARIAGFAYRTNADYAMIGGAQFLMEPLANALRAAGITPLYAFARRVAAERAMPNGEVHKYGIFKHVAFVEAFDPDDIDIPSTLHAGGHR